MPDDRLADDQYFQELLRQAIADHGRWPTPGPTPRRDAAALLDEGRRRQRQRGLRRLRALLSGPRSPIVRPWMIIASVAGIFSVVLGGVVSVHWLARSRVTAQQTATSAGPAVLKLSDQAMEAREKLRALHAAVVAQHDEPPQVTYTIVHTRTWSCDLTTGGSPARGPVRDETLYWRADLAGRRTTVTVPADAPAALTTSDAAAVGSIAPPLVYPPGETPISISVPSTRPEILGGQLAAYDPARTPRSILRGVAEIYRLHALSAAQRAAIVQVLADTDGLVERGLVTDRVGRTGLAITVDSTDAGGSQRDLLILDPSTGGLLEYELILLSKPQRVDIVVPAVVAFDIFLSATRVASLP
jgi:hypothetical protein